MNILNGKKIKSIVLLMILTIIILTSIVIFGGRYSAKKSILDYMDKQGIHKENILVDDFFKDWKMGGYEYCVSVKDEDPGIYYMYHYDSGKIRFHASRMPKEAIKEKTWGGAYLAETELENIKYPPLKE